MVDPTTRIKYRPATELVYVDNSDGSGPKDNYNAASMPIYQTATFKQSSSTQMGEYDYSRSGNPTRSHVENHLAKIMSAKRAFAVNSGMTALDVITRLVKAGEEVIAGNDLYGGTNRLLSFLATHNNVKTHHIDTTDSEAIIPYLSEKTRLVLLETPTNPLMKVADIPRICEIVHAACPNALVVVDNTMMSPYLQKPLELGADIVYHSGTKYLSGHHDLMAGVVAVKDDAVAEKIYFTINATGVGLGPFDCWLLMRGVKTLATHPQYELHAKMSRGPGAVLSFETGNVELSERLVELTRLWGISVSFGCVNSLISMPCRMSHASIPAEVRAARAMPEDLIRLCVGIEDVDDLLEDLYNALTKSGALQLAN
ncbi:cystathionine beta-lyase [Podila horticola]|nr:cystathionine beta-lyase [Podila horticola]